MTNDCVECGIMGAKDEEKAKEARARATVNTITADADVRWPVPPCGRGSQAARNVQMLGKKVWFGNEDAKTSSPARYPAPKGRN